MRQIFKEPSCLLKTTLFVFLVTGVWTPARGDEVVLTGGSRIVGEIQSMAKGRLTIVTDFAGPIEIVAAKIAGFNSNRKLTVALRSSERASGRLHIDPNRGQIMLGSAFGDVELKVDEIVAIWPSDAQSAMSETRRREQTADREAISQEDAVEIPRLEKAYQEQVAVLEKQLKAETARWKAKIEMGLNGWKGTSESTAFNGRAEVRRNTDHDRLMIFTQGRYAQQASVRNTNEILGGVSLEVDISKKWFAFGQFSLEFDEFEQLDLRSTVSLGMGYFWIRRDEHELKTRGGVGYQHESFMDSTDMDQGMFELGVDYMVQIAPWLAFNHNTTYYPTHDDFLNDYRVVSENSLDIPLTSEKILKLKVGMRNAYDPMLRPDVERLDTFYFFNVVYDLIK